MLNAYFAAPLSFNDLYSDAKAGEQLYHNGLRRLIRAILRKEEYIDAFCSFYLSWEAMKRALDALLAADHGIWKNFHRGDWLTDSRETVRYLKTAMSYTRIVGENLLWNSDWGIKALGLTETAIATMPQSTIPDSVLAKGLLEEGPEQGALLLRHPEGE